MVGDYLRNPDREVVMNQLKVSEPADVQFISWLAPNIASKQTDVLGC